MFGTDLTLIQDFCMHFRFSLKNRPHVFCEGKSPRFHQIKRHFLTNRSPINCGMQSVSNHLNPHSSWIYLMISHFFRGVPPDHPTCFPQARGVRRPDLASGWRLGWFETATRRGQGAKEFLHPRTPGVSWFMVFSPSTTTVDLGSWWNGIWWDLMGFNGI